jgi:hypothetical protein
MGPKTPVRARKKELSKLRENQTRLFEALQALYKLLEAYAPSWYTEEHHNLASAALSTTPLRRTVRAGGSRTAKPNLKGRTISSLA